ncbi:MAG TPA: hypothetical protein VFJ48_07135, partial [Casimicrobiaceae bacterium]|nr:hypothetical protein [Casimicrobiaceae bacterium]
MKRWLASSLFALMLAAPAAFAAFHLFQVEQLFSNADGTVQFVVLHEFTGSNGENLWGGNALVSMHAGSPNNSFTFPNNLPSSATAGKRVLVATQGFAALGIVTPDYTVSNGFLPTNGGTVSYAGVDSVTFPSLPTDGVTAINRSGQPIPNVATNFAGQTGSVTAAAAPPATTIIPVAGVYYNPSESGSGFGLDYQNGTLIIEVYSYLATGASQWYLSSGPVVNNVYTGTLDKYTGGQCISCAFVAPT